MAEKQNSYRVLFKNWLTKPFPFFESYTEKIFIPIGLSFIVMAGIIMLNIPSDSEVFWRQVIGVFRYGLVIILIQLFYSLVLPEFFPDIFLAEKWTVLKTLLLTFLMIITIGIVITVIVFHFENTQESHFFTLLLRILLRSIVLSFFPIILLVIYTEIRLQNRNHRNALNMIEELEREKDLIPGQDPVQTITFAENTRDEITLYEDQLLYIKAEGNYCNLVYVKDHRVSTKLIRSRLMEIEALLDPGANFLRCHKSYIVNMNKISTVTGNARGYLFHLSEGDEKIPVSRETSKSLIKHIRSKHP